MLSHQYTPTFRSILSQIVVALVDKVKGPKTVFELPHVGYEIDCLTVYSLHGFTIKIYCDEKRFECRYDKWYVPNSIESIYNVTVTVSDDAPESLKTFCIDKHFPRLLSTWMPAISQKEAAIQAYLDLLIQRFEGYTVVE